MISEEKTWITHEDWIDEEEINLKNLQNSRIICTDLDTLKSDARKYENEWEKRAQDRSIQKRLLIASALGLEDVVEKLVHSGADPCFKQNRFGYR
jgi:ankyrin repeat protein